MSDDPHEASEGRESDGAHRLAIATYVGGLILTIGVIVTLTGLFTPGGASERRLGFDLALWWGLVMVAFGALMLVGDLVSRRRRRER